MTSHLLTAAHAKTFIAAGDAIFTLTKLADGQRYTFRVTTKEAQGDRPAITFGYLLTGPNNLHDYTYMGVVDLRAGTLHLTRKSRYADDTAPVKGLRWVLARAWAGRDLPEGWTVQHEGRCGACGRTLTVPESIESGLGPICAGRLGLAAA